MWEDSRVKKEKDSASMQGILQWLNHLLNLNLTRIQELGSGSVYCQVFNMIHPGTIPMRKVNWKAKNEPEFLINLKLLQDAFAKVNIQRPLQPMKLAKAKVPDNFELSVWLRAYYNEHVQDTDCTINSSLSQKADFSFAHQKVVPKHFTSSAAREEETLCDCCNRSTKEKEIAKKTQIMQIKFQMIRQVIQSRELADDKLQLIEDVISLNYPF